MYSPYKVTEIIKDKTAKAFRAACAKTGNIRDFVLILIAVRITEKTNSVIYADMESY